MRVLLVETGLLGRPEFFGKTSPRMTAPVDLEPPKGLGFGFRFRVRVRARVRFRFQVRGWVGVRVRVRVRFLGRVGLGRRARLKLTKHVLPAQSFVPTSPPAHSEGHRNVRWKPSLLFKLKSVGVAVVAQQF